MAKIEIEKVIVQNVNVPDHTSRVDALKYNAMKEAFLELLPLSSPGLTQKEIQVQIVNHLSQTIFPNGAKSSWWAKTVQLDLEAKGKVVREHT